MSKNLRAGAYVGAAILYRGRVLLLRRTLDGGFGSGRWELPGGSVHFGESPTEALRREVSEETGLRFRNAAPFDASIFVVRRRGRAPLPVVAVRFLARAEPPALPRLSPDEHLEYRWVGPRERLPRPLLPGVSELVRRAFALARSSSRRG